MLDEIMVGISGPAGFQRQVMSNMTLALMADSGWYVPNWEASGYLKWGRKAGCDFLHGSCVTGNNRTSPKGFCTRQPGQERQVSLCSWDLMAVGTCQSSSLGDGCAIRMKYSDYVCSNTTQGNPLYQESKADWGETFGPHARCLGESDVRPVRRVFNVGQEPSIAEQWPGMELQDGSHIKRQMGAGCYKMGCSDAGELHVVVAGVRLPCPENGFLELGASKSLRSLGFVEGRLGPCPSSLLVCPELQCTEACEARGSCVAGSCGCHVGASGPDCGDMLCGNGTCLGQRDNLLCAERTCGQTNAILSLEPGESRPATNIMDVQLGQLPVGSILGSRSEILSTPRAGEDTIPGHVLAENGGSRHASNCRVAPASRGDAPSQHNSATDNCDPSRFARDVHQISFAPSSRHSLSKRPDTLLVLYFLTTWTIAYAWVVVA